MVQLTCILDLCPKNKTIVNYKRCINCKYFKGQKNIGTILCNHKEAKIDPKKERWNALKKANGILHII